MDWISYKDKTPTDKEALYLIEYGWAPSVSVIKTAHWDGKTFYNEDWETFQAYKYKDQVRHWFKIEKPKED